MDDQTIAISLWIILTAALLTLFFSRRPGCKSRMKELAGLVEPLGFDVRSDFDKESAAHFYQHYAMFGWRFNITSVCVADYDSIRIVVMEYHCGEGSHKQYFLGINSSISAPLFEIKIRDTETIWNKDLFAIDPVRFQEDPEFDENFVVRGDPERVRAFLNPDRRKALCETFDLPDSVSVCGDSVLIEYTNRIKAATFEGNVRQCLAVTKLMMGGTVQRDGDLHKPHNL